MNVTPDLTRGTVGVVVADCLFYPANGVQVTLDTADGLTRGFTTSGAATTITDKAGLLIFNNVPAGDFHATATPTVLGKPSSTVSGAVRAGAITTVYAFPTP